MAQAHSAQIQQDLLGSDQERLYREVMQESYNTIFRASPLQLQKSELLAHLKRGQEGLQSSSNGTDQKLVKEARKKWPEAGTWWNSYRSPVSVPTSDSSSSDDDVTSEKEEEESVQWKNQQIGKPRAALLGQWESVQRQGKACKIQHSRLQNSRPSFMKEKDLMRHRAKNHGKSHCFLSLDDENGCKEKPSPVKHKRLHLNPDILPHATYEGNAGVGRALRCAHCGKSYKQEKAFINHQNVCVRQQPSAEGKIPKGDGPPLTKNQITHVEMNNNTCFDCGKPVCKSSPLASEPKTDQEKNLQVCPECGESFRDGQCFADHLRSHQEAPSSQNASSCKGLGGKTLPIGQQETQEKKSRYQCQGCRRDYSTHYNLRRHQRIHTECRSRRNAHKGKDAACSWFFLDFQKGRGGKEPALQHKCTYCGKGFKTKSTLGRHQQIHIKGKPYKCSICGKAFVYWYTLAHHQEIHLEDQLYQHKCSFCTKAFRTPSALRRHQQLHKEGKPYICNICGKAFAYRKAFGTKYSLWRHQEMHVKEDPDSLLGGKEAGDDLDRDQASGSDDSVDKQDRESDRRNVPQGPLKTGKFS
ncbi:zinc finger protein 93-like [Crotalus adamanteus]|uniref:Zinc finger protein 93-like n=1 Tax=Crotalus adamanteus TaxID=8729 RepID=A0AAW1BW66_CROAD